MRDRRIWLRRAAVAALTAASFTLPMVAAYADPQSAHMQPASQHPKKPHPKKHAAKTQPRWRQSQVESQQWVHERCTWPYQNQFPPCMSTWPVGSPHYHGSRPGPTFEDEQ